MSKSKLTDNRPGFIRIDNVVFTDFDLSPYEFMVYAALCYHANYTTGESWPGLRLLQTECNMGRPKLIECIESLESKQLIRVERQTDPNNPKRNLSNHYFVKDANEVFRAINQGGGNPGLPGVVTDDYQGGNPGLPEQESLNKNQYNDSAKAANATYLDTWTQWGGYVDRTALELLHELYDTSLTEQQVTAAIAGSRYLSRKLLADMARRPDCYGLAADLIAQAPDGVSTVKYEDALRIATTLIHEHSITDAQTVLDRLVAYKRDNNLPQGGLRMLERPEVSGYTKTAPRNTQKDYEPEPEISPEQRRENIESMRQAVQDMEGASA